MGCTANIVYLDSQNDKAYTANLGDCRAMYCVLDKNSGQIEIKALSEEHWPSLPDEKSRIVNSNSGWQVVDIKGVPRIIRFSETYPFRPEGGLNVSRSIGDWQFKDQGVNSAISNDAEIKEIEYKTKSTD